MNYALIKDGVVQNVIVVDDVAWVEKYAADIGCVAEDVTAKAVSAGDVKQGQEYVPPVTISSSKPSISANGIDAVTVTYKDNRPNPPASVEGDVNGDPVTIQLAAGVGTLDVTSNTAGDTVTVTIGIASLAIEVT